MKFCYLSIFAILFAACGGSRRTASLPPSSHIVADGKLWSSLFQQKAAEYKALCLQAFNIAQFRLEEALTQPAGRPKAIVTDIDETFLDNSPYAVNRALQGKDYDSPSWQEWTGKGAADTLAGALGFFNFAASRQVEVFYITNRKESERAGTLLNLQRYHFPFADDSHLILRKDISSKESRRLQVAATHDIVLLLGDNLADFDAIFDSGSIDQRAERVGRLKYQFGKRFIVLPNANYGGWEDAVYGNRYDLRPEQKDSAIKANLSGY